MSHHDWKEVEPRMLGMWQEAFTSMTDVSASVFNGKHQPCPSCGGKDRFRFDNNRNDKGDGGAICSQCGGGNGMHWLGKITGWDFPTCVNALGDFLNLVPPERIAVAKKEIITMPSKSLSDCRVTPEEVALVMAKSVEFPTHIYPMAQGIAPDRLMVLQKEKTDGGGEKVVTDSRIAVEIGIPVDFPERGSLPELTKCNVAMIGKRGGVTYLAGRTKDNPAGHLSYGGISVIGSNSAKAIYLCVDWADAWHTHFMTGAQVWCCWEAHNMDKVAYRFSDKCSEGLLRMAVNFDFDELCEAEKTGCKVIIPASRGRICDGSGFEKVIYDPGSLLDSMTDKK